MPPSGEDINRNAVNTVPAPRRPTYLPTDDIPVLNLFPIAREHRFDER
jgi:hypothetical protein